MNAADLLWRTLRREDPNGLALVGSRLELTWGEVRRRMSALVAALVARGVAPGDRVCILSRNIEEYAEAYWAIISAGAVAVPLNFRLAEPELERLIAHTEPTAYLVDAGMLPALERVDPSLPDTPTIVWGDGDNGGLRPGWSWYDAIVAADTSEPRAPDVDESDPMAIVYTGGTTGTPKGVVRTHRNAIGIAIVRPGHDVVGQRSTTMCVTPIFHVAGQGALLGWLTGSTIVMSSGRFDAEAFLAAVARHHVESVFIVPTMALALSQVEDPGRYDLSSLREWRSGSAALSVEIAQRVQDMYPHVRLGNGAGSTEAGNYAVVWWDEMRTRPPGCIGRPPAGQEVRLVDLEAREVPPGELGEIVIRGVQVGRGYWNATEATEAAYRDGWLHTGDLGRVDADGLLYLVDRIKDMIVTGGENVYPIEVEDVIFSVDGVRDVSVVGEPDERWGEVVVAVVVPDEGRDVLAAVEAACERSLAGYKRPRWVVLTDSLPRTVAGKIDKLTLRRRVIKAASEVGLHEAPAR